MPGDFRVSLNKIRETQCTFHTEKIICFTTEFEYNNSTLENCSLCAENLPDSFSASMCVSFMEGLTPHPVLFPQNTGMEKSLNKLSWFERKHILETVKPLAEFLLGCLWVKNMHRESY